MNKKNLPGKKTGNQADTVQASESDLPLSKAQLLSVLEFSRQFPELTLHLATVRHGDEENKLAAPQIGYKEPLEFPPLVAPDPREIKPRVSGDSDKEEPEHSASEDEFALFAAGRLPPPEPAGKQEEQKKKKKIWKLLLPLTLFLFFLFWLHEVEFRSIR
jgi:hypothetical protein